jgi:YggT family protein
MNPQGALQIIIEGLMSIYIIVVFIRFLLQLVRADFYNPVSQWVVKATNPLLVPLRRIIPGLGGFDVAGLVLMYLLCVLKVAVVSLVYGALPPVLIMFVFGLTSMISAILHFFMFAIMLQVVLSWVAPQSYSPLTALLNQITEPVLLPARKILPSMGGLDFSPVVVLLAIQAIIALFKL